MTGMSLGVRSGSYGSLQHQTQSIKLQTQTSFGARKCSKMLLPCSREKERLLPFYCRYLGRRRVGMLILSVFALLAFVSGFCKVNKDAPGSDTSNTARHIQSMRSHDSLASKNPATSVLLRKEDKQSYTSSTFITVNKNGENKGHSPPSFPRPPRASIVMVGAKHDQPVGHQCDNFAFPPPPPPNRRRPGPRPCPVCYIPVEHALASMPSTPTPSPVLRNLMYVYEENPTKTEQHGGSEFGGYPSLMQRNNSFDVKESMAVHCGFVKGIKPGRQTGFDIDEADRVELEQPYDVIVASAIFGNYDVIQQPINISEIATKNVPFFMFIDEETEAYMKNSSSFDGSKRVGLWRIVVVRNIPYTDARRNGKVPKLLLHRLVPNIRYSIWIDGKLQLVVDPYQILERFLWRQNATLAISKHYTRFDVFVEAEANKAAGKYDNASINDQIEFYKKEGLTPYSVAKLPIASDVPEGCVIIREHIPITNLFTCLWFNEVDRFTARDQLSFSTVRDKIMSKVNWTINMFMDCERRNFVVQAYHRDLLEHMAPPVTVSPPALVNDGRGAGRSPAKKNLNKRGKGERRSSSRRHRKVASGTRDSNSTQSY